MKFNLWKLMFLFAAGLMITLPACDDDDDEANKKVRLFRPVELTTNFDGTTVELSWLPILGAQSYNMDLSKDSLKFTDIVESFTGITELPVVIPDLEGGARYSVRIMAIAENPEYNSEYAELTFMTPTENILYQLEGDDVGANDVVISWDPEKAVTHIVISSAGGGEMEYQISADEQALGEKLCDGLTGETNYTAEIFNGEIKRGSISFKTLIDIGDATLVGPDEDLIEIINAAGEGTFVLEPGDYTVSSGVITATGSLTVKALNASDKPTIHAAFYFEGGTSWILEDLNFSGYTILEGAVNTEEKESYATRISSDAVAADELILRGCTFSNYDRSLLRGTEGGSVNSLIIDNCIVDKVTIGNNEFLDLRSCAISNIAITNTTFSNSSSTRHFLRCDDIAGFEGQVINIENCTFYNVATPSNRVVYVRTIGNMVTVKNNVFSEMADAQFRADDPAASYPVIDYNYYHNAVNLSGSELNGPNNITDDTASPFADAENGDFSIDFNSPIRNSGEGNAPMGDPRWIQ
ncbi:DUF5123 domain-containing protein [Marinilabilia salmonicolor]|uniref:Uncharacterized protein DUF4957 n=1 Tax=Marinilabilia salmonicolor TaxID=989 RepID=A0A368UUJ9_9BACT|nr:DUF5123 domain-containing protein [Marinilabilia salmonicolor]RCW32509.1 uncharacterized protein DUF4957 [Marinilabilia salmonicolor]